MAKILIRNLFNKVLEVTDTSKTLLYHFHSHHLDWMHSCGGKGQCTTCKVIVLEGIKNFSPLTDAEQKYIRLAALQENERLACQVRISDDIVILVPDQSKLPHLQYSA